MLAKCKGSICWLLPIIVCLVVLENLKNVDSAAVMSVDLGSEWMKIAVISPGVPMEIVLNRESKRKTPATIAFRGGLRTVGDDALTVGIKEPASAYGYLLDLLGKTIDNPIVQLYRKRFPYYNIIGDPERNTVIFKKSEKEQHSVEELVAQILMKAKEFTQESTNQVIQDAVLTVPGYFGQAERTALLTAAKLANIKVLQLINDYTAVALNYGVFRPSGVNDTSQYYIFYDMGASHTSAAVVKYQLVKDKHTRETNPVVQVLGVAYDRTLGGLEIQLRLRDYLAAQFNAMKKTKTDVTKSPRALAKLFKEASRLKNVLSANNDHYAQIENLLEDHDFRMQVTREKLEELCSDLWPRVIKPLEQALANSALTMDVISQVILFGGGTRVPKVQDTIKQFIKQDLGKSLNADEAAAMGAVYKAADLATGFKVKKFIIKDAVIFPIQVSFERDPEEKLDNKVVKRVLFGHMAPYPQKKVITFNKRSDNFNFQVHFGDLSYLSAEEQSYIGETNLFHIELQNLKELLEKTANDSIETKGIKAYFALDDSGIFHNNGVELIYDKQNIEAEDSNEGTLAKLGNTISKLFSKEKGDAEDKQKAEDEQDDNSDSTTPEDNAQKSLNDTANVNNTAEGNLEKQTEVKKNDTIKIITLKEPIHHTLRVDFTPTLSSSSLEKAAEKLNAINKAEHARNRLESSFNALESHIVDMQHKLEEEEYASCLTPEDKTKILLEFSTISEWLYEDIENPSPEIYEKKLGELQKLTNVFMARHWEHEERPEALDALENIIEAATKFLESAKNLTKDVNADRDVFTQIEIDTLAKVIEETINWKETETAAQNKLKRHEDVRLTVEQISSKMSLLDREVKYLVNKIKIWKPKVKPTIPNDQKLNNKTETNSDGENEQEDKSKPIVVESNENPEEQINTETEPANNTPSPTDATKTLEEDHTPRSEL